MIKHFDLTLKYIVINEVRAFLNIEFLSLGSFYESFVRTSVLSLFFVLEFKKKCNRYISII